MPRFILYFFFRMNPLLHETLFRGTILFLIVSPGLRYGNKRGWHLVHLGSCAAGGAGIVFTESTHIELASRIPHPARWFSHKATGLLVK